MIARLSCGGLSRTLSQLVLWLEGALLEASSFFFVNDKKVA